MRPASTHVPAFQYICTTALLVKSCLSLASWCSDVYLVKRKRGWLQWSGVCGRDTHGGAGLDKHQSSAEPDFNWHIPSPPLPSSFYITTVTISSHKNQYNKKLSYRTETVWLLRNIEIRVLHLFWGVRCIQSVADCIVDIRPLWCNWPTKLPNLVKERIVLIGLFQSNQKRRLTFWCIIIKKWMYIRQVPLNNVLVLSNLWLYHHKWYITES